MTSQKIEQETGSGFGGVDLPLFGLGFVSVVLPQITGPTKSMSSTHPQTYSLVGTE